MASLSVCLPVSSSSSKAAATFVEQAKLCHNSRRHRNRIAFVLRAAGSSMSSLRSPSLRAARNLGIQAEERAYPLDPWPHWFRWNHSREIFRFTGLRNTSSKFCTTPLRAQDQHPRDEHEGFLFSFGDFCFGSTRNHTHH